MKTRQTFSISLPPEMAKQVESAMKAERRTRSELIREALRVYISIRRIPEERPTPSDLRAIRRGEAAYQRGDYTTLDEYLHAVDRHPGGARRKVS